MKKLLIALLVVVVLGGGAYLWMKKDTMMPSSNTDSNSNPTGTPSTSSAGSTYKDGTYTGDTVQADRGFGPIQVQAVVKNGKIVDIVFLQMPSTPGHTTEVTEMAKPLLKQEAISSQKAQVDTVSGATQDTDAFNKSLASALAQAK